MTDPATIFQTAFTIAGLVQQARHLVKDAIGEGDDAERDRLLTDADERIADLVLKTSQLANRVAAQDAELRKLVAELETLKAKAEVKRHRHAVGHAYYLPEDVGTVLKGYYCVACWDKDDRPCRMAEFHRSLTCLSCRQSVDHPEVTAGNRESRAKVARDQSVRAQRSLESALGRRTRSRY